MGLLAIGVLMVLGIARDARATATYLDASWNWVELPCEVKSVGFASKRFRSRDTYYLRPRYVYRYSGRVYVGTRYDLWDMGFDEDDARGTARALVQDKQATCYVNPDEPSESVFLLSITWWQVGLRTLLFGGVLLVVLCVFVHEGRVRRRHRRQRRSNAGSCPPH